MSQPEEPAENEGGIEQPKSLPTKESENQKVAAHAAKLAEEMKKAETEMAEKLKQVRPQEKQKHVC